MTGQQTVKDGSQRVNVGGRPDTFSPTLLGCHVARSSHHRSGSRLQRFFVETPDQTEVTDLGNAVGCKQNIGRLKITMDNGFLVGVTANDAGDGDVGSNDLQNFPQISEPFSGADTHVVGVLHGAPNANFRLEFFSNPAGNSNPQGQNFLGSAPVTTDGGGVAMFSITLVGAPTFDGDLITGTATDANGNTLSSRPPSPQLQISRSRLILAT